MFTPNLVLQNRDIFGYSADFSVQKFLEDVHSPLVRWKDKDGSSAAHIIERNAKAFDINAKFILATLQKEQSLLTHPPTPHTMDWALGFGATDSGRIEHYRGFSEQLTSCCNLLQRWGRSIKHGVPVLVDHTGKGHRTVVPENLATAICYHYTPWVGDVDAGGNEAPFGNKLLWMIWQKYFEAKP